jgi:hypothetical protein
VSPNGVPPLSSYGLRTQSVSTADVWVNESKIDTLESQPSVTFGGTIAHDDIPARFKLISQVVEDSRDDVDATMLEPTVFNDLDQNDVMRGASSRIRSCHVTGGGVCVIPAANRSDGNGKRGATGRHVEVYAHGAARHPLQVL